MSVKVIRAPAMHRTVTEPIICACAAYAKEKIVIDTQYGQKKWANI